MSYQIKCTSEGVDYRLTYGKGSRKLTVMARRTVNGFIAQGPGGQIFSGKLREVKEQWGAWAAEKYAGGTVTQSPPGEAPEIVGSTPAFTQSFILPSGSTIRLPIDVVNAQLYHDRQAEIDNAVNREEAEDWFRHVTRLEQAHVERDPSYTPHIYTRKGPPSRK